MKVMLDTNICIALIKRKPVQVLKHFAEYKVGNTREFSRIRGLSVVDWLDSRA